VGLLTGLITLPFAPVRGTIWLAEQIAAEAERRLDDPALIRQQLEEIGEARAAGTLPQEEADRMERELVGRLLQSKAAARRDGRG
jgi:hypothetical protein